MEREGGIVIFTAQCSVLFQYSDSALQVLTLPLADDVLPPGIEAFSGPSTCLQIHHKVAEYPNVVPTWVHTSNRTILPVQVRTPIWAHHTHTLLVSPTEHQLQLQTSCVGGRHNMLPPPVTLTFDLESSNRVMCDVGYLCASFSLPRPFCSQLRPDVRDRQTLDSIVA